jgi:hypothetical protein
MSRVFGNALGAAAVAVLTSTVPAVAAAEDVKLSGCLVSGEDGDGYLLTNVPGEPAWQRSADATVAPGPVGTSGTHGTIFYWLDDDDGLKDHVGHVVEIEGELEGDLKKGEIEVDRKDAWTEVKVSSDGRSLKARVPHTLVVVPANRDSVDVLVRKVDVESVRMRQASCPR